jgi:hypothetical protein
MARSDVAGSTVSRTLEVAGDGTGYDLRVELDHLTPVAEVFVSMAPAPREN